MYTPRRLALLLAPLLWSSACDRAEAPAEPGPKAAALAAPVTARVRVRVEAAEVRALEEGGEVTGVVQPFARATVAAELGARVTAREVERGDRVEAGDLLYRFDGSRARLELQRARVSLSARRGDLELAELERRRSETLRARDSVSAAALDRSAHAAQSAEAAAALAEVGKRSAARSVKDSRLQAPFSGVVAEFHAEVGDFVGPGTPVLTLVDLSRVRLRAGVTAAELRGLELGAKVPVEFADLGGRKFEAELRSISPIADARTGTYAAELWLDNPEGLLLQGMVGRLSLAAASTEPSAEVDIDGGVATVPREAVIRRDGAYAVWIVEGDGAEATARLRPVVLGRADRAHVEVREGVALGERVVTDGQFALRDGASVEIDSADSREGSGR